MTVKSHSSGNLVSFLLVKSVYQFLDFRLLRPPSIPEIRKSFRKRLKAAKVIGTLPQLVAEFF